MTAPASRRTEANDRPCAAAARAAPMAGLHTSGRERLTAATGLETAATVAVACLLSNAFIGPVFDPKELGGDSIGWLRLVWLPVYAIIGALALWRAPKLARAWGPLVLLAALVAWAAASAAWSILPDVTLRRCVAVAFTTLFGVYLAARYEGARLSEMLGSVFLILAAGSLVAALAFPVIGVHQDVNAGAWRGLWYEKNALGAFMAYGAVTGVVAAGLNPRRRALWLLLAAVCVGLVLMSRSKTALLELALALGGLATLVWAARSAAAKAAAAWLAVTAAGAVAMTALLAPAAFYKAIGKDPTLTGRTDIWEAVGRWSAKAPALGYGYAAFWDKTSIPARFIRKDLGWKVPNAHNGWLDLRVELGWIGVALAAATFSMAFAAVLLRARRLKDGYWAAVFLVMFLLSTLSESFILQQNSLAWALAAAAITRLLGPAPATAALAAARTAVADMDAWADAADEQADVTLGDDDTFEDGLEVVLGEFVSPFPLTAQQPAAALPPPEVDLRPGWVGGRDLRLDEPLAPFPLAPREDVEDEPRDETPETPDTKAA